MSIKKTTMTILIILGVLVIFGFCYFFVGWAPRPAKISFGVSFSKPRADGLNLDWEKTYLAILDELKVKKLRLAAYWHELEYEPDKFYFNDLDWQIEEAEKRGIEVILVIGRKLPGWPECFEPDWTKNMTEENIQERVLLILKKVVERYKDRPAIRAWQVENEPLFPYFGICPKPDKKFFDKEIALVKSLDNRPIVISDSGELSSWFSAARRADIFGTTIYRVVQNPRYGYFRHVYPPVFYWRKAKLMRILCPRLEDVIVSEFQAEPWAGEEFLGQMPIEEQDKSMNFEQFQKNINFAKKTGFSQIYLWGAEWWFWRKEGGDDRFWKEAQKLF